MSEKIQNLERTLCESERQLQREIRGLYIQSPELAARIAEVIREIRSAKTAVVQTVQQANAS